MRYWVSAAAILTCVLATSGPVQAQSVVIDLKTLGTVTTFELSIDIFDITADDGAAPAEVFMLNLNGLGVIGGASNSTTDGSEALHFEFLVPVVDAAYNVGVANNLDADGFVGEHFLEAFDGATSLGTIARNGVGWQEVSDLFGGVAVTSITVRADVDGNRIDGLRYELPPQVQTYCTAKTNSLGCVPQIGWTGTPSVGDAMPLVVTAGSVLNAKNGLFFYGVLGPNALPFLGGTLCATPPLRRTTLMNSGGSAPPAADCSGGYAFDLEAWMATGSDPNFVLGMPIHGQFWSRDPQGTAGVGLTDAIEATLLP